MRRLKRWHYAAMALAAALAALAAASTFGPREEPPQERPFHDFVTMSPEDYQRLVDPSDPEVVNLARQFRNREEAYLFVRDKIAYTGAARTGKPGQTIKSGVGSCLGKAALLCSLYRAMGMDEFSVRVVTGIIGIPGGLTEHAWLDLEEKGKCWQQDASGFLGAFDYAQFPDQSFVDFYVVKELILFNDEDFGIISQANRAKGMPGR